MFGYILQAPPAQQALLEALVFLACLAAQERQVAAATQAPPA